MALNYSTTLRNNQLDQVEATVGASAKLYIYQGTKPTSCADSDGANTLLATLDLPSDWMAAASSGSKAKAGTWQGTGGAAGTAGYFRIRDSGGTTCHLQGSITATADGGDMTLDNTSIASGQTITVTGFTLSAGNA
jgi:hypothetical protein